MFRCQQCGAQSKPREPQFTLVTTHRDRVYEPAPTPTPRFVRPTPVDADAPTPPAPSRGWEIVAETRVCKACYATHSMSTAEAQARTSAGRTALFAGLLDQRLVASRAEQRRLDRALLDRNTADRAAMLAELDGLEKHTREYLGTIRD